MVDSMTLKHQQAYARTVLAHLMYSCLLNQTGRATIGHVIKVFEGGGSCNKDLLDELESYKRAGRYGMGRCFSYSRRDYELYYNRDCPPGSSHLCVDGTPFVRSPLEVKERVKRIKGNGYCVQPLFFSDVITDPAAFLLWCREKLAESSGKAGKKVCTRFPKDDGLPVRTYAQGKGYSNHAYKEDPGRHVRKDTFLYGIADSYLLHWWDALVAAEYDASVLPLKLNDGGVVSLVGPISEPTTQNRKASAADVADYINKLVAAVKACPVACGLMASGRKPDDPSVKMFVSQPSSISRRTSDMDSARHASGWMDMFTTLLTQSFMAPGKASGDYGPKQGSGMSMAELLGGMLDIAREQAAIVKDGGQLELVPSKELVSRLHDSVTNPDKELAMEMTLVFTDTEAVGEKMLKDLGLAALAMHGHAEFETIRKTAMNRIKATNESFTNLEE